MFTEKQLTSELDFTVIRRLVAVVGWTETGGWRLMGKAFFQQPNSTIAPSVLTVRGYKSRVSSGMVPYPLKNGSIPNLIFHRDTPSC
jgi:hypothetical protein